MPNITQNYTITYTNLPRRNTSANKKGLPATKPHQLVCNCVSPSATSKKINYFFFKVA